MRIKKLSMMGFKSFMDRIDIPFPLGISAVVGPNGCGKSNIVDAIRWAMGEQSAKQLRGRNMEDIIFNGATDQKPLGMAEVSIVLENGDGSFPPEFAHESELSITRRLYRSGESEYLLNNVPCRLKDIQELFMDTGLGNRAYSIIGQGRIGSIVEQKPEETRIMIEEAAGITKFKKKEAEARRKMELTKRNLQRVEDILAEVQTQMRSLKRQAGKARRYKAIGQEIQRIEMILHANSYQELKIESGNKIKSKDELNRQEARLLADISSIQARIEEMNLQLEEKDEEVSTLRNRYQLIKDEYNRKESTLESLANEKRLQAEMEERLIREKEEIKKSIVRLNEEKESLIKKSEELNSSSDELKEEILIVEKRLKSRKELLTEMKEEYERVSERINSDATKEAGLNQESNYLNKRIGEITDTRTRLEKEIEDLTIKSNELNDISGKKNEVRQALSDKHEAIQKDLSDLEESYRNLEGIEKGVETELKSVETNLNISQSRLSSLKSLTDNFEGYQVGVRTVMKAKDLRARKEGRIIGLVADFIQVEPKYEQAVEAVMSDTLQYIIVETHEDSKEAIDYLKAMAKGRGSFVPLRELNGQNGTGKTEGFPLLRDLVKVSDSYRPVINMLLGDTAVAENLETAISAWSNNGRDHGFVTPEGDMVDSRGVISGGKFSNGPHGLLARKREIKELQIKTEDLEKEVVRLKQRQEEITRDMESKKKALNDLNEERLDCQDKLNELDRIMFQLSSELDQIEQGLNRLSNELEKKTKEQTRHKEELNRIESELRFCGEKKRTQEEYRLKKRLELKESEDEFDEIRNELEKLKMDLSLSVEEKKGISREIDRIEDYTEEAKERIEKIDRDTISVKERQTDCTRKEEELRQGIMGYLDKLRAAEEAVNTAQQTRNNFHADLREQDKKGDVLRDDLDQLKEKINFANMEQHEIKIKMENLAETVQDRFNLNLIEVYEEYLKDDFNALETKEELNNQKQLLERLGDVNLTAIQEHEVLKERHDFIQEQRQDLLNSMDSITQAIRKINRTCLDRFLETFEEADKKIKQVFPILFNGGAANLKLTDENNPLESGILVEVRPPGKKLSHMGLLSGGEKALVAMALLFAIYLIKPSPFCLLDEVDAPLDEANIDRFNNLLREIRKYSQILMVTHNRRSMEIVDSLFGITMENAGISKLVSVNLNGNEMN